MAIFTESEIGNSVILTRKMTFSARKTQIFRRAISSIGEGALRYHIGFSTRFESDGG
ncbi:hypothetical protein NXC14_PA00420 (plasmid) [Rhizobium sp. NXC14]|nr:hypothetical protein NXC14_PA00420 [Rhizobium sp. NXC14]